MTQAAGNNYAGLQNLGWLDRLIRFIVATAMVTSAGVYLYFVVAPAWADDVTAAAWPYIFILAALYIFLTAAIGFEPIYKAFNFRTCGNSPRNPCGSFPYEIEAAAGEKLRPNDDVDHSLENTPGRGV